MSLTDKLIKYSKSDIIPMHMPGHKRRSFNDNLPYSLDITEIDGFDNLHNRKGIIKELTDRMAALRSAKEAFLLTGGSTLGILAGVYALTSPGDKALIARNCHKSVYHACEIRGIETVYIYPEEDEYGIFDSVSPDEIEKALCAEPGISLVIITSPTYEGIISNIAEISDTVRKHGARLLVDAAHGAHLGYSDKFPADALSQGADISVESLHKTLPALTQTAAMYISDRVNPADIEYALDIFETSSPSYILMASADVCVGLIEKEASYLFDEYSDSLERFTKSTEDLKYLKPLKFKNCYGHDKGKIIIPCKNTEMSGAQLSETLRKRYGIETEMSAPLYVICMTGLADTDISLGKLSDALHKIEETISESENVSFTVKYPKVKAAVSISGAIHSAGEYIPFENAQGRVSRQYIMAYPPGIPAAVPGEIITKEVIEYINLLKSRNCAVEIPGEYGNDKISVIKDN